MEWRGANICCVLGVSIFGITGHEGRLDEPKLTYVNHLVESGNIRKVLERSKTLG
jgi:hypothetical protein